MTFRSIVYIIAALLGGLLSSTGIASAALSPRSSSSVLESAKITRGPYLQMGTPHSIIVRWRTDIATSSRVWYGRSFSELKKNKKIAGLRTEHEVQLTALRANTKYFYAIGFENTQLTKKDAQHFFVSSPKRGSNKAVRIWVLGDSGTKGTIAKNVRKAYEKYTASRHTNLWLMLGDNAYNSGTDEEYQQAVFNMYPSMLAKSVLWPSLGNHETYNGLKTYPYYDIFSLPTQAEAGGLASKTEAYYSFDYANIHFVVLDSQEGDMANKKRPMLRWLAADLEANHQQWTLVMFHHGPYTMGSHNSDSESQLIAARSGARKVFEEGGVDLVLSGHSHAYERSYLLDGHGGNSDSFNPQSHCADGGQCGDGTVEGDGPYKKPRGKKPHQGIVYVIAGSAGHATSKQKTWHPAMQTSLLQAGSVIIDIEGPKLNLKFLNVKGDIGDSMTLIKTKMKLRATPSPTVTQTPSAVNLLNDFEGETPLKIATPFAGRWQISVDKMGSSMDIEEKYPVGANGSDTSVQIKGYRVFNKPPEYSYTSFETQAKGTFDLSMYEGIQFWFYSDGGNYQFNLKLPAVKDYAHYGLGISALADQWSLVKIPFKSLVQPGWGKRVPLELEKVLGLQIYNTQGGQKFEYQVDEIGFYKVN